MEEIEMIRYDKEIKTTLVTLKQMYLCNTCVNMYIIQNFFIKYMFKIIARFLFQKRYPLC